jgi:hypothetical protein
MTTTSILVVLDPPITLRRVDHYYSVCTYVWCDVNFIYTLSVCIDKTSAASCALDHIYYPIMFFIITIQCIGLILMGPNRSPSVIIFYLVYP